MGLFDKIFGNSKFAPKNVKGFFKLLNGYTPVFRTWDGSIYESELVRSSIDARARHISKLAFDYTGSANTKLKTQLKAAPNPWTTWSKFFYRLSTILDVKNTAFIVPIFGDYGETIGISTFCQTKWELLDVDGDAWIRFYFSNGDKGALRLSEVGIMTKFQYESDFFGSDNNVLNDTMSLIMIQKQGIEEYTKNASSYRFMAKITNFSDPEDLAKERVRFDKDNFQKQDGGGLLLFPNNYDNISQIQPQNLTINPKQMELIQGNVFNYFGVNEKILQNSALGDDLDAFFNGAIEPFSIMLSDVMTAMIFSTKETACKNKILITANRLQYMSVDKKISMAQQLGDRGAILIDEIRDLFNYPPLPDNKGQHAPIRGEYYMVGEEKKEVPDDGEE